MGSPEQLNIHRHMAPTCPLTFARTLDHRSDFSVAASACGSPHRQLTRILGHHCIIVLRKIVGTPRGYIHRDPQGAGRDVLVKAAHSLEPCEFLPVRAEPAFCCYRRVACGIDRFMWQLTAWTIMNPAQNSDLAGLTGYVLDIPLWPVIDCIYPAYTQIATGIATR